ncbi:Peptidase M23 [Emticicia oligotrophica DSM 17448]|uniref:Peptidase M23 n=1 Tax=Emticicia oligotrophica (strain DSM 17448 / CIP 109782 / MTCC 6937 / GPTSA100-15) TaxID=929562 RepID=A0ABM5N785_EMTOG|nr:M23 family metallopeptidase [Emticicia oligotrophica]AFK05370.1 Peptidase M23 [Emticicia oligotrophica DSM 17448]
MIRIISTLLLITYLVSDSCFFPAFGQHKNNNEEYPKGYFMFPIQPGQQASLSGGFGDLRTNHFHAGIDIRTGGVEGYQVFAAADGYISKIRVMKGGYGNVLYITHPNGYTTVYGHLKNFNTQIEEYVRRKEYAQQVWDIELSPSPKELQVKKGEIVAIGGNTGASGGPHLHFEIRDEAENAINPLKFGFPEIQDSQAPVIERVILKTLNAYSRVNGEFGRVSVAPTRSSDGFFNIPNVIKAHGVIGLELNTYDRSQTSPFRLGITQLEVKVDGKTSYKLNLEKMPFDISKDINVHMDYDIAETNGVRIQKCYVSDGNRLSIYQTDANKGKIIIRDNQQHQVSIEVKDTYGNYSNLNFTIQGEQPNENFIEELAEESNFSGNISTSITENTLAIRAKNSKAPFAVLQYKGIPIPVPLSYKRGNESVYLHDLNKGVADFVQVDNSSEQINIKQVIYPIKGQYHTEPNLNIDFADALYDTLYLKTNLIGNRLSINTEKIPLKDFMTVTWAPSGVSVSPKAGVYYVNDGRKFLGGSWLGNKIQFKTKELGDFQLLTDNEAPSIRPVKIDSTELRFSISDGLSGIKNFNCYVDGEWVLMDYEYKSNRIWSIKLDESKTFHGDLKLEVTDNVGNLAVYEVNIDEYTSTQEEIRKVSKKSKSSKKTSKSKKNVSKSRKSSSKHPSKKSKRKRR